jgi:CopG antitoxin of type II toxin-antitoxin system
MGRVCSPVGTVSVTAFMATHVRKNITLPRPLDERLRKAARKRGTTQSGLIVQLIETGLAAEAGRVDSLLSFVGIIQGPPDLSETIDETVHGG